MRNNFPQLLVPGLPQLTEPWAGDYEIVWSIYIVCKSIQKLHRVHIPTLEAIIGQPHAGRGWAIEREEHNPGEIRIMTVERLARPFFDALLLSLLKKLYALRPNWSIGARLDEDHPHGVYVHATHVERRPDSAAPAVSSAMVELQPDFSTLIDEGASKSSI